MDSKRASLPDVHCMPVSHLSDMIRYLGPDEIDRQQWDDLLTRAPNGLIYALSWYLDIVSPGWAALVKEEAGRYLAVLPLPTRRKFGISYLQQPVFTQQLGLFYEETLTAVDWQEFSYELRKRFRYIAKYAFNTFNTDILGYEEPELLTKVYKTYHLSLAPTYKQILAAYKPTRRWCLKQARQQELRVELTTNVELLIQLFDENVANKVVGIIGKAYEYKILRSLYNAARQRDMVSLWQSQIATGEVVAMIMLLHFKGQITYIFSGATQTGKKLGAVTVLLDEVFRTYAEQAICFDFEAMDIENLITFYSSFGSKPAPFLTISANRLPWPVRQLKAARMALYQRLRPRPSGDAS